MLNRALHRLRLALIKRYPTLWLSNFIPRALCTSVAAILLYFGTKYIFIFDYKTAPSLSQVKLIYGWLFFAASLVACRWTYLHSRRRFPVASRLAFVRLTVLHFSSFVFLLSMPVLMLIPLIYNISSAIKSEEELSMDWEFHETHKFWRCIDSLSIDDINTKTTLKESLQKYGLHEEYEIISIPSLQGEEVTKCSYLEHKHDGKFIGDSIEDKLLSFREARKFVTRMYNVFYSILLLTAALSVGFSVFMSMISSRPSLPRPYGVRRW